LKNNRKTKQTHRDKSSKEAFDVKKNLQKLKKYSGFETETESVIDNDEFGTTFNADTDNETFPSTPTPSSNVVNNIEIKYEIEKVRTEITKNSASIEKELSSKIEDIQKEKLDKNDFKWWIGGVIFVVLLLCSVIYSLSYSQVLKDIEGLKNM